MMRPLKLDKPHAPAHSTAKVPSAETPTEQDMLTQPLLYLTTGNAVHLQRLLGNQGVKRLQASLIGNKPLVEPAGIQPARMIQRRKTEFVEVDFIRHMRDDLGVNEQELKEKIKDSAWTYADTLYKEFVQKGRGYWGTLQAAIAAYGGNEQQAFLGKQQTKRQDYDQRFERDYDFTLGEDYSTSFVNSKNNPTQLPYTNAVHSDEESHSITAKKNYARDDKADPRLPNSEIIWQQYKKTRQAFGGGSNEDLAKLTDITRDNVVNIDTLITVFMVYPNGETAKDNSKNWQPGTDEFFALLGTENLRGSPHLLADHLDQIRKTISHISTLGNQIIIHLKNL